jgi:lipopolysaccharide biosynthesis regulator YciM
MSINNAVLHQLQRIQQEKQEIQSEAIRHRERLETMNRFAEEIIEDLSKSVRDAYLASDRKGEAITWLFRFGDNSIQVDSSEVLAQYDPEDEKFRYFKDIMERLIVDKLSKLHP